MQLDYIYDGGSIDNRILMGIDHKVLSQVKAFNDCGIGCKLICPPRKGKLATILQSLPFIGDRTVWREAFTDNADAYYIRRPVYVSKDLLVNLQDLKRRKPKSKIILEIPTWPYDKEMTNYHYGFVLLKDRHYRKQLKGIVDRIVDLSGTERIFGIPTIQIQNGIDLDTVRQRLPSKNNDVINIVFVAMFAEWHGADRIIKGIAEYLKSSNPRRIMLHMVGEGPVYRELVSLSNRLNLNDSIQFHGNCTREEMDEIYDACTFGIASLGLHRIGLDSASTLKTREYLAKGLPFVYSGIIKEFQSDPVDFCVSASPDDSALDVSRLIAFYDNLYSIYEERELIQKIRAYAVSHVGMKRTMEPVFEYLRTGD